MDPISDGCRLCLDSLAECFTTIDNPQLKDQMEKVFCFPIEPKPGYSSNVCQSCSYAISEFFQYSEKVRKNQEVLNKNVTNSDPTIDSKITLESVKIETLSDSGLLETTKHACESKDEVLGEEIPNLDSIITIESVKIETLSDSGLPETEDNCKSKEKVTGAESLYEPSSKKSQIRRKGSTSKRKLDALGADEPTKNSKQFTRSTQRELNEQDQLFNKHISMICDLCGMSAATFTELRRHFWKEHKRSSGYVVCCKKKLYGRYSIRNHINSHAKLDEPSRNSKQFTRSTQLELNEEDQLFNKHFSMICDLCGMSATTFTELRRHFSKEHKRSSGYVVCCNKKLIGRYTIRNHINFHAKLDEPTRNSKQFTRSTQRELNEEDQLFNKHFSMICDLCGMSAATFTELRRHFWTEHKRSSGYVVCCNKKLFGRHGIRNHINFHAKLDEPTRNSKQFTRSTQRELNEEDQLFNKHFSMICDLCGMSAATFTELRRHFWKEHKRSSGYVVCCNKKLFGRYAIRNHIDVHANPDVFRCEVCGSKYKNKVDLNEHMLCMHSGDGHGPLQCHHCPQSFAQKSALYKHMEWHVKLKCSKCNKMFARKSALCNHISRQHSGKDREITCDTCGQKFLTKKAFDRHMNDHMGSKDQRFQCEICRRWLKSLRNLRNHMKTVHQTTASEAEGAEETDGNSQDCSILKVDL